MRSQLLVAGSIRVEPERIAREVEGSPDGYRRSQPRIFLSSAAIIFPHYSWSDAPADDQPRSATGFEIARLAASRLQDCADQMELERARDLLRRERVRIEQALARLSVPGREELAGQDEMADAASQLYEEEFDEGHADDLR